MAKGSPTKKRVSSKKPARKRSLPSTLKPRSTATVRLARDLRPSLRRNTADAERLIEDIERRKARISNDFVAIGRALRELSEPRLYRAAGHASFKALLRGRKLMSSTSAFKLMAVAEAGGGEGGTRY